MDNYQIMQEIQRLSEEGGRLAMLIDFTDPDDPNKRKSERLAWRIERLAEKLEKGDGNAS